MNNIAAILINEIVSIPNTSIETSYELIEIYIGLSMITLALTIIASCIPKLKKQS